MAADEIISSRGIPKSSTDMFSSVTLARAGGAVARARIMRALHSSRTVLSEASAASEYGSGPAAFDKVNPLNLYKSIKRTNTHVLEKPSITTWQEVSAATT